MQLLEYLKNTSEVQLMNKKEAVAYAQITLESMLHSNYKGNLDIENFGLEMRQAFKLYPRDIVLSIAESKIYAEKRAKQVKPGDCNEK